MALSALFALAPSVRAAERITLNNGFIERCDHHAQVDGRMRLYLSTGEDNYIELAPGQVASIEVVPDPAPAASAAPTPGKTSARLSSTDLREMLARTSTCWRASSKRRATAMCMP